MSKGARPRRRGLLLAPLVSAALVAPAALASASTAANGPSELRLAQVKKRPVAMIPGLKFDQRTMIPRGICRAEVWEGL